MKNKKWSILCLTLLFVILSILVKTNYIKCFDDIIYNYVTSNMNNSITKFYKIITFLGSTKFIVGLCMFLLILFIILKKKNTGLIISITLIISTLINNLLKNMFVRERPEVIKFVTEHSYSYPSGHTMAATTMYGIIIYIILKSNINKTLKLILSVILGIIPILVALSRIYLGAHFASDVVGAIFVSTIILLVTTTIIDKKNWI